MTYSPTTQAALERLQTQPATSDQYRPMNNTQHETLTELHNIACAAAHSLKCIDGFLESRCDEDGFTYEDAAGCVYNIKRSIHALHELVRKSGLKGDPLFPEWSLPSREDRP